MPPAPTSHRCTLALEDGTVFAGGAFGAGGTRSGEVVFNTSITGYQEILPDPSYFGQIVNMTSPQIGNYRAGAFVDVLRRSLDLGGYEVRQIMNLTDVGHLTLDDIESGEDKLEAASRREGKTAWEIRRMPALELAESDSGAPTTMSEYPSPSRSPAVTE